MSSANETFPWWLNLIMVAAIVLTVGLTWVVTKRGADGRLEPNPISGMRTRATMASPEAWQAGHVAALAVLRKVVPVTLVLLVVGVVLAVTQPLIGFGVLAASQLMFLVAMWPTIRAANRAAKATLA